MFWQKQKGWQVAQPSARTQNGALRKLAQKLPEQDNEPTIIDGLKARTRPSSSGASQRDGNQSINVCQALLPLKIQGSGKGNAVLGGMGQDACPDGAGPAIKPREGGTGDKYGH